MGALLYDIGGEPGQKWEDEGKKERKGKRGRGRGWGRERKRRTERRKGRRGETLWIELKTPVQGVS